MEAVRTIWTDERMDDLNQKVDGLGGEMRSGFKDVRTEMREEFRAVRSEVHSEFQAVRSEMRDGFSALQERQTERFDALQRGLLTVTLSISGSIIAGSVAILATQL